MRRLDNIDLRLLRVFVAVVDARGFANAQIALNLSPSTLSTHITALERKLGGQLCQRGRRGFQVTGFGEKTYVAALKLFNDLQEFENRIGQYSGQLVGRLRIGIVDGVIGNPQLSLQLTLARFMNPSDHIFIDLELGTPDALERAVADEKRDIVIGPFSRRAPGVTYVSLCSERQGLYCGAQNLLFDIPDHMIGQEQIEQALFSVRGYRYLDDLYRVNHPRSSGAVMQMEAQEMMILSGHFIGFLPCHIGDAWAARRLMRAIRPENYSFGSQHFAAVRDTSADEPLIRAFLTELQHQASQADTAKSAAPRHKAAHRRGG